VDALAVDPGFAILPVQVVAKQFLVQAEDVRILREHDVPGMIERETVVLDRPAPATNAIVGVDRQTAGTVVVRGRQAGRTRAQNERLHVAVALAAHRRLERQLHDLALGKVVPGL
jgi:hypothetical protein